jgi:hypothetical protein
MRSQPALVPHPVAAQRADAPERTPVPLNGSHALNGSHGSQGKERFERLLRDKSRVAEQDDAPADPPVRDAAAAMAGVLMPKQPQEPPLPDAGSAGLAATPAPMRSPPTPDAPRWAPAMEPLPTVTVAALQAAAKAEPPPPTLPTPADADASTWEVSVHEPLGVPVELRAVRVAPTAAAAQAAPAWNLTVASPNLDRAVLARHATRLEARLRGMPHALAELHLDDPERGDDADA